LDNVPEGKLVSFARAHSLFRAVPVGQYMLFNSSTVHPISLLLKAFLLEATSRSFIIQNVKWVANGLFD
jgi:hypothetical protein